LGDVVEYGNQTHEGGLSSVDDHHHHEEEYEGDERFAKESNRIRRSAGRYEINLVNFTIGSVDSFERNMEMFSWI
jgi:hypothetical protein